MAFAARGKLIRRDKLRILVVGLGHVGLPLYYHLGSKFGAENVFAIDKSAEKVTALKEGLVESREPGVSLNDTQLDNIAQSFDGFSTSGFVQIHICVDVSIEKEIYDTRNLMAAIDDCGAKFPSSLVLIRSTISPEIISKLKDKQVGRFQCLAFKPEFLREGLALKDLEVEPNYLGVIVQGQSFETGHLDSYSIYEPESLSLLKVANNAWRATKVSFGNMLATLSEKLNADPREVSELFLSDTLNVSEAYLRPGSPYGGYCLPKETEILAAQEKKLIGTEMLEQVSAFNNFHIKHWAAKIIENSPKRVIFTSLSFKREVEDLRNSPYVAIAEVIKQDPKITVITASPGQTYDDGDVIVDVHNDNSLQGKTHPAKIIRISY